MNPLGRTRVAVLGGGPAGIAAAFELTATPELRERYEVTVHQLGWRLGGKCASGRNAAGGQRIEEHGLHIWFGFYDNAFALIRRCYEELGRAPFEPLATWRDAFKPCDDLVLYEQWDGRWISRRFRLPRTPFSPGEEREPTFWSVVQLGLGWLLDEWERLLPDRRDAVAGADSEGLEPAFVRGIARDLDVELGLFRGAGASHLLRAAARIAELGRLDPLGAVPARHVRSLWRLLVIFKAWLWERLVEPMLDDDELRFFYMALDFWTAAVRGIVEDGLVERGFGAVNGEDLRQWLARHGAEEITLAHSPFVRGYYDLAFAYEDGDKARPNMAAGAALQALVRMLFSYKGAFLWKMQAGMGDTVFSPLYEVLRARGVRFELFHWITRLGLSPDRGSVATIEVSEQARVRGGREYSPLVPVNRLPCWPSEPDWDQLEDGEALAQAGADLERDPRPPGSRRLTLRLGEHFDQVVLAIPVAALPDICGELVSDPDNPRFAAMLEHSRTVMTQAVQVWVDRDFAELGWPYGANSIAGAYQEPLDTFCDMTQLSPHEDWPGGGREADIGYFCGVLAERSGETRAAAIERVRAGAIRHLDDHVRVLWPGAADGAGFDWRLLVDPQERDGQARIDAQYVRANFNHSERYALTPAGSVQHRLWPDESGYENLYLAGDWTRSNIDGGSVEGAVTSGMLAARALAGSSERIRGLTGWMAAEHTAREAPARAQRRPAVDAATAPRRLPAYVEYGGLTSVPGPLRCLGTTLYGFWVQADHRQLTALCERVFRRPTAGAVDYYPLGDYLMITFGVIDSIVAETPPFHRMGTVTEPQVALWMPVVAVRRVGPALLVERFAMFVPYLWLDNPISIASGREMYGWAKNFGRLDVGAAPPHVFTVDAYGMNYGRGEQPGPRRLITIERSAERGDLEARGWNGLRELAGDVAEILFETVDDRLMLPGLGLVEGVANDLSRGEVREVFLKQFRSVENGLEASLQQVIETPMRVTRLRGERLPSEHDLTVEPLDSHPLIDELGLRSQRTRLAYKVEMDFVVETGSVLWDAAVATREVGDGDGPIALHDVLGLPVRLLCRAGRLVGGRGA